MKFDSGLEASTTESVDPLIVAEVELDLSEVRSRITDLSIQSLAIATDLLAVLSPLHQQVVDVIDLQRAEAEEQRSYGAQPMIELTEGSHARPAMLELASQHHAA